MVKYCYPRGYISRYCDGKVTEDDSISTVSKEELYTTNGSTVIHDIMLRAVSSIDEPHYAEEVIRAAVMHFGVFSLWVRDNCTATPFLSCAALSAISMLMDCVDMGVDIESGIRTKQAFVETYPDKAISSPDKKALVDSILGRLVEGHPYNTDEVIRSILANSENSLMTLVDVIIYFFGYIENPDGFSIAANNALAWLSINAAKPM